ncbi:cysteine-rich receptor-like protein kinase 8 [Pistacia vera]|uniref:cysteine-rich receptor-like protein kinase 8 n=1 Tax=Pistacia vera TaxID=55513 RepID=UPI001263C1C6|nr:cysteine-rich receptor-like protein kinase 8 [Pistacia vera]
MTLVVLFYLSSFLIITFANTFIPPTFLDYSCPPTKNFTVNSTYHSNLNLLFSSLPSNVVFHETTSGEDPDKVYGLFLCRGDLNSTACHDCVISAIRDVTKHCPIKKEAVIWYDECHLRYSNQPFFSLVAEDSSISMPSPENVTEPEKADDLVAVVLRLMSEAARKAAYSPNKFAGVKRGNLRINQTLYGLVQCTQDLSSGDCSRCLEEVNAEFSECCRGKKGGRVFTPSCSARFEFYLFFKESFFSTLEPAPVRASARLLEQVNQSTDAGPGPTLNTPGTVVTYKPGPTANATRTVPYEQAPTPNATRTVPYKQAPTPPTLSPSKAPAPAPATEEEPIPPKPPVVQAMPPKPPIFKHMPSQIARKRRQAIWIAIGTIIPTILVLLLSGFFLLPTWRRYKEEKAKRRALKVLRLGDEHNVLQERHQGESKDFPIFPLGQILEATGYFSDENKLGEGGFGPVYKGVLADGKEIAVKRLSTTSGQGLQEFKNEVVLIAKLQHNNLVRLLGCCLEEKELLLIYEYMPNKSLNFHLFDLTKGIHLHWKTRVSIINGIARGLLYLHEDSRLKIIHRDLKTGNILLDHEMKPKISDFGMARIFCGNQIEASTNRVVGTYGYMAPEYAMNGIFSVKSDVFSFGVLLLEIISGRKNTGFYLSEDSQSLIAYAWKLWCEGKALELMDPTMVQSCVPVELLKFIHIGLLCVQEDPTNRPTMSTVVVMLVSDAVKLPKPTQPAFSFAWTVAKSDQSPSNGKGCSINEVTLSNLVPR